MSNDRSPIILAFSGGLDTSFCVPWLKENYGRDVITACVDTGGIDAKAAAALHDKALALGAIEHILIDAKQDFFDTVIRHLIAGNVLRGHAYPLCVRNVDCRPRAWQRLHASAAPQRWRMAARPQATTRSASRWP